MQSQNGDAQSNQVVLRGIGIPGNVVQLTTGGGNIKVPKGTNINVGVIGFQAHLVGIDITGANACSYFIIEGAIKNIGGTTSIVASSVTIISVAEDIPGMVTPIVSTPPNEVQFDIKCAAGGGGEIWTTCYVRYTQTLH